eukprot:3850160-Rhodomonas_salina.1
MSSASILSALPPQLTRRRCNSSGFRCVLGALRLDCGADATSYTSRCWHAACGARLSLPALTRATRRSHERAALDAGVRA